MQSEFIIGAWQNWLIDLGWGVNDNSLNPLIDLDPHNINFELTSDSGDFIYMKVLPYLDISEAVNYFDSDEFCKYVVSEMRGKDVIYLVLPMRLKSPKRKPSISDLGFGIKYSNGNIEDEIPSELVVSHPENELINIATIISLEQFFLSIGHCIYCNAPRSQFSSASRDDEDELNEKWGMYFSGAWKGKPKIRGPKVIVNYFAKPVSREDYMSGKYEIASSIYVNKQRTEGLSHNFAEDYCMYCNKDGVMGGDENGVSTTAQIKRIVEYAASQRITSDIPLSDAEISFIIHNVDEVSEKNVIGYLHDSLLGQDNCEFSSSHGLAERLIKIYHPIAGKSKTFANYIKSCVKCYDRMHRTYVIGHRGANYYQHLKSKEWLSFKSERKGGKICDLCGSRSIAGKKHDLHHVIYHYPIEEQTSRGEDFIWLCRSCHDIAHGIE